MRTPLPSKRSEPGRGLERLAVCEAVVDRQRAEAERALIRPVEVVLARHDALDVVVVDVERVLEIGSRPLRHADAAVDLFALVAPRKSEREAAVDGDLAAVLLHAAAGDIDIRVLDDEARLSIAPGDVERAHVFGDEMPFDARPAERLGHHARELGCAADGNRIGRRAERRHHAGQHAIAFLQVGARHVKRNARIVAPRRAAAERDIGVRRRESAVGKFEPVLVVAIASPRRRSAGGRSADACRR